MRHRVKRPPRLDRKADHRGLLLRNLATDLLTHEKLRTTATKAKALQPFIDRVISTTLRKQSNKREALRYLQSVLLTASATAKAFTELPKKYPERTSGFTRITALAPRHGDGAPTVQIELV